MPELILKNLYDNVQIEKLNNIPDLIYSIIQIKELNPNLVNYQQSLYVDLKLFISTYIESVDRKDYGYDVLNIEKIISSIESITEADEKISLYLFSYKLLKEKQFENDAESLIKHIRKSKLQLFWTNKEYWNCFFFCLSYSLIAILLFLLFIFLICYLVLLPATEERFMIFNFCTENFCDIFYFNHLLNLLCAFLSISSDIKIEPLNWWGVILLLTVKSFYVICVVNYFYRIILERLNLSK